MARAQPATDSDSKNGIKSSSCSANTATVASLSWARIASTLPSDSFPAA
jgi:hypothetical protein